MISGQNCHCWKIYWPFRCIPLCIEGNALFSHAYHSQFLLATICFISGYVSLHFFQVSLFCSLPFLGLLLKIFVPHEILSGESHTGGEIIISIKLILVKLFLLKVANTLSSIFTILIMFEIICCFRYSYADVF